MQVTTLLLAEGVSVDAFTGRVTPFNLVDTVFAPVFPARVTRLHVLVQYERPDGTPPNRFFEKMELVDPSGADVLKAKPQELTLAVRFHSSIHNAWNVKLQQDGDYVLKVSHAEAETGPWVEQRRRTVVVKKAPHPLLPAEPPKAGE